MLSPFTPAAVGAVLIPAMMTGLWLVGRRLQNMAVVDVGWTAGLGLLGLLYATAGDAPLTRRLLIAAMATVWSARLGIHLYYDRIHNKEEEGRYRELRRRWEPHAMRRFFIFYQIQGLTVLLLATPFWLASRYTGANLTIFEIVASALFLVAMTGETVADRQLVRFKREPSNHGKTCKSGLWRHSRHPNYFFEWLNWCAFALLAAPAPFGAIAILCPIAMLYLMLRVTGIPETEAQALRSRGDDYRQYQLETSAFFPWFHRVMAHPPNTTIHTNAS